MNRLFALVGTAFTFALGLAIGMMLVPPPEAGSGHNHDHSAALELTAGTDTPALDFDLMKDPASGWNIHLHLINFTFSPENASTSNVAGEGHGHTYVSDVRTARLYGDWCHISQLRSGDRVTITLNSNDHSEISVDGKKLAITKTVP